MSRDAIIHHREIIDETLPDLDAQPGDFGSHHLYIGNRCIYCNTNDLDATLYGPQKCQVPTRERIERFSFGLDVTPMRWNKWGAPILDLPEP